jgi:uroporphyrinogen decarboxylase
VNHRQRLEVVLSGDSPDRTPVALWRHFPVDDQSPGSLAAATLEFQQIYDFDLVKVTPASSFCLKDWGAQDAWRGSAEGNREYTHRVIKSPDDWISLPILDPTVGHLGEQLDALRLIRKGLAPDVPILQTIFNPLSQAKNLVGGDKLLVHLRQNPEAIHAGLARITLSTLRFLEEVLKIGVDGFFYAIQHAQYGLLSESEYREFGQKYDLEILDQVNPAWLNMLHLHGVDVMFDLICDYPVQIINWHDQETHPSLPEALSKCEKVVCGGLRQWDTMLLGTPASVRQESQDAIQSTGGRRLILGTGCVTPVSAPRANILAARQAVLPPGNE